VRVGLTIFLTDRTMRPAPLAKAAEERGFHSLYFPEHTHIPVSRRTPAPTGDEVLDDSYLRTLDPFAAIVAAATVTESLLLGTGVALVVQHDPIALAKTIATADVLSGGRVVLGVGFGWNREEMEDHGVDFATRRERTREHVLLMQSLWRDEVASYAGDHVRVSPSWAWPKPVQQPRGRTLIGGAAGPKLFAHIAEYGDGWIPIGGAGLADALPELRNALAEAGRDPAQLHVVPFGTLPSPEKLDRYRDLGVTEVVLRVPAGDADAVLPVLDDYRRYLA
jgi:probable F420-dependent oxidoreductase